MTPTFLVVDLFCGAGGTTQGFSMTDGKAKVIACVNHDPIAIKSHWANHPEVAHFEEDIRTLHLAGLKHIVRHYRRKYPKAKLILWASLECTNFSKAKGGQPRDADSRTLADFLDRYILAIKPDYVQIENVVEFMSWGPLDAKGKPVSRKNGTDWNRWRNRLCSYGYRDEWKQMNSADFGAYTSRNRLFGCFAKEGLPIVWPEPTHSKKVSESTELFDTPLKKWMPVKDVLDFSDEGKSIFRRKKELSPKTFDRIYAGLIKHIAGGKENFILKYNSTTSAGVHHPPSTDAPCPTIACQNRLGVAFISKYFSGDPDGKNISVEGPAGTIKCIDSQALVQASFISQRNSGDPESKIVDIEGPARTLTSTGGNQDLIQAAFLHAYYGNGDNNSSVNEPAPTIPTKDRCALVHPNYLVNYHHSSSTNDINDPCPTLTCKDKLSIIHPQFLDKQYGGADNHQSLEQPAGSILANDKHCLVSTQHFIDRNFSGGGQHQSVEQPAGALMTVPKMNIVTAFVMNTNYANTPTSIEQPAPTITANRKWAYLVNPSWGGANGSIDKPCPVIVARQDKAPLYLINAETGQIAIQVYDDDLPIVVKIKEFMALYGIVDIKMRMLKVVELLKIQGFPADYKLHGNQTDQKKFIGNSVVPHVVMAWTNRMTLAINELSLQRSNIKKVA
ncbi:DNA cytosine methyltransferase [Taibaiella lutea]|uniref:DNA (cytosine-5-)-methyltransferase n=1 Tax=Taibaiella lutea TaxID=2608001 RepID=A0A5M6CGZ5_9BACT|nr:DNA cytosine methyltransferase [Taibaiella lutea]KAA5532685.1 DNA cytosine methyltransferase [Taibaiella lutea]